MRLALGPLLALAASTASAAPMQGGEPSLVVAGGRAPRMHRATGGLGSSSPSIDRSAPRALPAGWQALWDRDTGVPLRMWGSYVGAPGAVQDAAIAERAARAFLAAHVDLLAPGAVASDFVLVANELDGDVRTVGFAQTWGGLPVIGGQLGFVFAHDRLFAIGSEALPHVHANTPQARASEAAMRARAESWLLAATGHASRARTTGQRAVLPIVHGPGDIEYHVVDVLDVAAIGATGRWDVYAGADGSPIARHSRIATYTSTLQFDVGVRYATGTRMAEPAPADGITINAAAATTATDGTFMWTGTTPAAVTPSVVGTYVQIINQAGGLTTGSLMAQPGTPTVWSKAASETEDAQLSAFIYANTAKARARIINPAVTTWLDSQLVVYVNEAGTCNAYSTGDDVHFFQGASNCENTGRVADVVFHEFGHSLHAHSIIAGMGAFDQPLSEGLADFNAANITEDHGIGRGFFLDDMALRDIDPPGVERHWPEDDNFDPHVAGEVISGALWDLRKTLVRDLGHDPGVTATEKIFTGIMQLAADIPSTYTAALIADDDDGDLGNGTPHYCAIEHAFGIHGLVTGFQTTSASSPSVTGLAISVPISTPTGTDCPPPSVTSVAVTWKVGDGVASAFDLAPSPDGTAWTGTFPDQPEGTVVQYSVDVALDDGSDIAFPNNPADPMYQLFVGTPAQISCEDFDQDPMWMQTGILGTEWDWGRPGHSPDPTLAFTGTNVLGTNVTGDGFYRALETTSILTPQEDVSAYQVIHLQYWRWLTVEDAMYDTAAVEVNGTQVWQNATDAAGTLDHVDKEWRFHDIDITPYLVNGTAQVAWRLTTDGSKELGGWTLDDVCFVGMSKIARCGDNVLDDGEQCDDGNTTSGDGCSATCVDEIEAGGGGCAATGDPAGLLAGLGLVGLLARKRRARPALIA